MEIPPCSRASLMQWFWREGEDTIDQIAAIIAANPDQPKDDMLLQLSKIPHVYVPKIHGAYSPLQFSASSVGTN